MPRNAVRPKTSKSTALDENQVEELILQALETEIGGIQVYQTALECATNEDLQEEWEKYLEQTQRHEEILRDVCENLGIDADKETPGRGVVRHLGESLVQAMQMAIEAGDEDAAQLVACECVVLAETKDHSNWELLMEVAERTPGESGKVLSEACEEVEEQEDEHLYHTKGWCRELWLQSLGIPAALPPPEEKKDVKSAIGAARAKNERKQYVNKSRKDE